MVELTDWAREILSRADAAARRLNPDARVRLSLSLAPPIELRAQVPAGALRTELVDTPEPGDQELSLGDATIYLAAGIDGLLDVEEPHDRIVLRPSGSPPNVHP